MDYSNLRIQKAEALKNIKTQIGLGHKLLALPITTPQELQSALDQRGQWLRKNADLVIATFDDSTSGGLSAKFNVNPATAQPSSDDELQFFHDSIRIQIHELESLLRNVENISEPISSSAAPPVSTPTVPEKDDKLSDRANEDLPLTTSPARKSFKETVQSNLLVVFITACAATAITTGTIVDWVKEQQIKNLGIKDQADMAASKQEWDAKRREYEQKIKDLELEIKRLDVPVAPTGNKRGK